MNTKIRETERLIASYYDNMKPAEWFIYDTVSKGIVGELSETGEPIYY